MYGAAASVPVGGEQQDECAREVADARDGFAYPAAAGVDGLR